MTYIPTQAELEEIGFSCISPYMNNFGYEIWLEDFFIKYYFGGKNFVIGNISKSQQIYPQSRQDIETLINLFTQPN